MSEEIKIRKGWPNKNDFDPSTKIETPKPQKKNRSSERQAFKKAIQNIESWDELDDLEF